MLNIDNDSNFLFIHIPKCAGTSIEKYYNFDYDNNSHFESKFKKYGHPKHMTISMYEKFISKNMMNNLFKFTIIRNPFDLIVSLYNYSLYNKKVYWNGCNTYEEKRNISFKNYILYVKNLKDKIIDRLDTTDFSLNYYIKSKNTKIDYICKFENLENDLNKISNIINLDCSKLPKVNKSKVKNVKYKDYYNNSTKDIIYKLFKEELKMYNYDF
jgi:hypothetical protein